MASEAAQRIGGMVADLLGDLERDYGADAEVLDAFIAVEVMPPEDESDAGSIIEHRSTTRRLTVAVGLVRASLNSLLEPYWRGPGADDDE